VAVRLRGSDGNTHGVNAMIKVTGGPVPVQLQEMLGGNRYLSSDDFIRAFAAGKAARLTIEVLWRNGQRSVIPDALPNSLYEIRQPPPPRAAPVSLQ
jgi:hypothetical protein